jgi:hypothetical protein
VVGADLAIRTPGSPPVFTAFHERRFASCPRRLRPRRLDVPAAVADVDDARIAAAELPGAAMKAPARDVVKVLTLKGERGGVQLVHVMSCGHWTAIRTLVPRKTMACIGCFVAQQLGAEVAA